ncbi:alpha/beta hydrolase [Actinomadura roseirufa]|uniref:alpha/beta hydrolase n=1 Tax=Actinomadura roseirufa TaxID=2094049 RepID=UPI0010413309|nr:alpha/beta hydrolase [Actinomadura roseirufa]
MTRIGRTPAALPATLLATVLALGALFAAGVLLPRPARADPEPAAPISWRACPDDRTARCGKLTVPVDWSAGPGGGTVGVAVARAKATGPGRRLGVLFVNPGGPGGSGVDFVTDRAQLSKRLRERYDIVGFDPRGVGGSHAVKCGKVGALPPAHPRDQAGFAKLKAYQSRLYTSCRQKTGPLYDFLDAGSVARDMDAIRAALGEEKVSYYGLSYGTWLGQRYAELFPERVGSLVLDSTMDHSVVGAERFSIDEARALEAGYRQFTKWCPTSKYCALRKRNPVKVLDGLMRRADRKTLHDLDSPKTRLTPQDLAQMVRMSMYNPLAWAGLSEQLRELSRQKARPVPRNPQADPPDGAFIGILCDDWSFPVSSYKDLAAIRARTRRAAPHVRFNPLGWEAITACVGRPRPARDPQRPYRIAGTPPILVVNGVGDPVTAYPWARTVQRAVPGSVLLTYEGAGHGAYGLSPCARKAVDAYLVHGSTSAPGARCPAMPPDFDGARAHRAIGDAPRLPSTGTRPRWDGASTR